MVRRSKPLKTGDSMFVGFDSQNTSHSFYKNLPVNHHHLGLGHFLDGVFGAFLPEAAVLEAAVG